jgi:subtilase family serine protease
MLLAAAALATGPFAPDLQITAAVGPQSAAAGSDIQVQVRFANRGAGGAQPFMAELWLEERVVGRPALATARWQVRPLSPDDEEQSLPVLRVPATVAPGAYSLRVFADRNRDVPESDETNNEFVRAIQITAGSAAAPTPPPPSPTTQPGADLPDLVVERWWTPASTAAGSSSRVVVRLANTGQGAAGPFACEVRLGRPGATGAPLANVRWDVAALAPGQPAQREVVLAIPAHLGAGEYVLRVAADVEGTVAERNEQNNLAERTLRLVAGWKP